MLQSKNDELVLERIELIMREKDLKQVDLVSIVNVSPQAVNNWFKRRKISASAAKTIADATGYSLDWLLSGRGNKYLSNISQSGLKPVEWEEINDKEGEFVEIPFLDLELSAGDGSYNYHEAEMYALPFRAYTIQKQGLHPKDLRVVRISGNSMEPRLYDDDVVCINMADTRVRDGKIYAVRIHDTQKVKKLVQNSDGTITVKSYNPEYQDEIISKSMMENNEFQILGRVWWVASII